MKKQLTTIGLVLTAVAASGCAAMSTASPVTGFLYTSAKGPHGATANPVGAKVGRACASSILGIVGTGDASVAEAARSAGITQISTVDSENFGILGIYATNCTVVTGN